MRKVHTFFGISTGEAPLKDIGIADIGGDGDIAIGEYDSTIYNYRWDASSTATESIPDVVNLTDNTGDGRFLVVNSGILTFATLVEQKASTATDDLYWNTELKSYYQYIADGVAYTPDDLYVTITGNGGNTRRVACSGKYIYEEVYRKSVVIESSQVKKQTSTTYNADHTITLSELGKTLFMDAVTSEDFTLPSVGSTEDRMEITLCRLGAGACSVLISDSDTIGLSGASSYVLARYSPVTFVYIHEDTKWITKGSASTGSTNGVIQGGDFSDAGLWTIGEV